MRRLLLLLILIVGYGTAAHSQSKPFGDPRRVLPSGFDHPVDISRTWLVQSGDNPAYASPAFDDSGWHVLRHGDTTRSVWHAGDTMLWLRSHVELPAVYPDLAISVTGMGSAHEVYVNGRKLGGIGPIDGTAPINSFIPKVYPIPVDLQQGGHLTIAIRNAMMFNKHFVQGAITSETGVLVGSVAQLHENRARSFFESLASNYTIMVMSLIVAVVSFGLFIANRSHLEYFDLTLSYIFLALYNIVEINEFSHALVLTPGRLFFFRLLGVLPIIFLIEFARRILLKPFFVFFAVCEGLILFLNVLMPLLANGNRYHWGDLAVVGLLQLIGQPAALIMVDILIPVLLFRAWRRGNTDAGIVCIPIFCSALIDYAATVRFLLIAWHVLPGGDSPFQRVPGIVFNIAWTEVATFISAIVVLLVIIIRTIRIARERAALSGEIEAAQTVQTLLLARASRPTPGFKVETAYRPASQVGGDFFLVSPYDDGSLFAIVGDVSGKGMQAAMRVSLILGALNRESSREPAEVLQNLNLALLSQGEIGFTTACALHIEKDGRFSFANAGHLNPYLDGQELVSPGALPLGLSSEVEYTTEYGHLSRGQRLVLLSDGVPEAQTAAGELYGFDKLLTLTRLPAEDIAETAHQFGQSDDITVLTLALA